MGDFNETLYASEHFSRSPRPEGQMRAFREATDDCSFQDLGWTGCAYTWDNRQSGDSNVKARLDRAFANEQFRQHYEYIRVKHLASVESDHCFVVADIQSFLPGRSRPQKQFRYENVWQSHVDYDRIIAETWRSHQRVPGLQGISDSLDHLRRTLVPWGAKEFGCLTRNVRQLQKKLNKLRSQNIGQGPSDEEKCTMKKLQEAMQQEEMWMKQHSRVLWLRAGDRNTSYFQAQAAQRKRMNRIVGLR